MATLQVSEDFEEWKPVSDYPDYLVSDRGRVMRCRSTHQKRAGQILALVTVQGYRKIGLWRDGVCKQVFLHRIMCDAFNGPAPFEGALVRHLDGDPLNNRPENLAWGTHQDNSDDKRAHGRVLSGKNHPLRKRPEFAARGSRVVNAKIDEATARHIKDWKGRAKPPEVAERLGVSIHIVRKIWSGETWRHV